MEAVGVELGCSPASAMYLYRATPEAVVDDDLGRVERVLYLTAAMTGLRQGELLALRWRDIDWSAGRVRVMVRHAQETAAPDKVQDLAAVGADGRSRS